MKRDSITQGDQLKQPVTEDSVMKSLNQLFYKIGAKALAIIFALSFMTGAVALAQDTHQIPPARTGSQQPPPPSQPAGTDTITKSQSSVIDKIETTQAALVSEFDVNGLKVLIKRRAGSQTVAAGLFIRGGARNITAENAGIENLMLVSAVEASVNFPRERLRSELARMGTTFGSSVNYDYSALSMASTRPNFDRSWEIFTDIALRPAFTKEDVGIAQNRIVASLRDDQDDPDTYLQRLQERAAYAGHPYINRPEGTAESVARLTPEDLRRYHQQMMQTSRLLLVIVGDLDAQQLRERINASFGRLPRGSYSQQPVQQLAFTAPSVDITQRTIPTNYVQGIFAAPPLTSEDIYPMRVASFILSQRVLEEVRFKRNLSYAPDAFLGSQGANIGGIYVTATDTNQAVRVMLGEITRLQQQQIDADDITAAVSGYLTNYYLRQETNAAQAGELAQYELIGGGWRNALSYIERLRAVRPSDVERVAQKYMRNLRFVVLGDPASVDKRVFTSQSGE
ncbi:MAG TPA: pitrilysin family protein [Pyrinomonadaceae bacterium]|nr:pitrilysin family protein [Pyrinomonadaceae bacterium]